MTREETIDILKNMWQVATKGGPIEEALEIAIEALEEPHWISVSERLPEMDERVLVTTGGYDYYVWDCMSNRSDSYFWEDESGFYHDKHEVIAWMPLPEAWRGDAE